VRRVVTGHDGDDHAVVWLDGEAGNTRSSAPGLTTTLLWATEGAPALFVGDEDAGSWSLGMAPPPGGSRFLILTLSPGSARTTMHRTDTLDYVVCLVGEMTLWLDDSSVTLRAGDVLVQRGTNHCWENRTDAEAAIAVALLDGRPKRVGSVVWGERAG
jgi:quercetin dioxygenase-like cupin family protein